MTTKPPLVPHPTVVKLRELRTAAGLSLQGMQEEHFIPAVVIGSYERGDRKPSVNRLDEILHIFGYELVAVPIGSTVLPSGQAHVWTHDEAATVLASIAAFLATDGPTRVDPAVLADVTRRIAEQRTGGAG